ncbi:MAG: polysaccharide biosynthesis protein [Deltaproteobacteria bacterium]|nr:polysaccharide biosynthesis protein [Deltaproteobacteria bacterium]
MMNKATSLKLFEDFSGLKAFRWSLDACTLLGAFLIAHGFYFSNESSFYVYAFWILGAQALGFGILKLDLIVWRYIGFYDLKRFGLWALYCAACSMLLNLAFSQVPVYVPVFNAALVFFGFVSARVLRRATYEYGLFLKEASFARALEPQRTLLVGAGEVGMMAVRAFGKSRDQRLEIIGFVDDDERKQDSLIQQLPVLGSVEDLPELVEEHRISQVIISIARISRAQMRRILDICKEILVEVRVVPGYSDIVQGNISVGSIREIRIEDLLGREPILLDSERVSDFLREQVVLVTGAGGSIGSELCRQIIKFKPKQLLLLDISESALFEIQQELQEFPVVACVCNCADYRKIFGIMKRYQPDAVFHAAAYKHVGLMERNPFEALDSNALGSYYTALAAAKNSVKRFVLVSTDKAVEPKSVMGASKHLAEKLVASLTKQFQTEFRVVRFGNVLGSSGSVVPIFKKQIAEGGPVTVTDPEMRRYFMTIPEACQLILQAASSDEEGNLFILDMGEPVRILDLARDMIRLAGFEPGVDIPIDYSGKKSGEKLSEELSWPGEILGRSTHQRLWLGKLESEHEFDAAWWQGLSDIRKSGDEEKLRELLSL